MFQQSSWIRTKLANENVQLLIIALFTWISSFVYLRVMYIGRDARWMSFTNFLYFSDSLKSGILPLWNHLILSGSDFVNLINIGLFFPFQWAFVLLGWIIAPFYAFELMLQSVVVIGGIGCYLLCRTFVEDKFVALFGATAFTVAVLVPVVAQVVFLFSFASFPWLLLACIWIVSVGQLRILSCVSMAVVAVWFISAGYLWMNLVQLFMVVMFSFSLCVRKYKQLGALDKRPLWTTVINLLCFLGMLALLYACLMLPGYLSVKFYYHLFWGDYVAPDSILRGLAPVGTYSYRTLFDAFTGTVDPMITINNHHFFANLPLRISNAGLSSVGAGVVPWLVFLIAPWKSAFRLQRSWLLFACVAFLYSAGQCNIVGHWLAHTPIFNANRWWFVGAFYVSMFVIFSVVTRLPLLKTMPLSATSHVVKTLFVLILFLSLCLWFHSPAMVLLVLVYGTILVYLLGRIKNSDYWRQTLIVLMILNVLAFIQVNHHGFTTGNAQLDALAKVYSQHVNVRVQPIILSSNYRRLGTDHDFQYKDDHWLLKKVPFSHGFNHVSHPLYWYVKNAPFLSKFILVTQHIRKEQPIVRDHYASDNAFATALMDDVLRDPYRPTIEEGHYRIIHPQSHFAWRLGHLLIGPNTVTMSIRTNGPSFVQFNNLNFPGWAVYVDGKRQANIRSNRIFQGVFLDKAGHYDVKFVFRPIAPFLLVLPYVVLLGCGVGWLCQKLRRIRKA